MSNSPFIQLFLVILAGAIVVLYVRPTITTIRATQDKIGVYQDELARVAGVNNQITEYKNTINSLSLNDVQALERYLPNTVDEISVLRDLEAIAAETGITLTALAYEGQNAVAADETGMVPDSSALPMATFKLGALMTYDTMKVFMAALESNNYPLIINKLEVALEEGDQLGVSATIVTYSLSAAPAPTDPNDQF